MSSQAYTRFDRKLEDVQSLLDIHKNITRNGTGKRVSEFRVLNKSAIVLLVASWETYVESLLEESVLFLLEKRFAGTPSQNQHSILQDLLRISVQKEVKRLHTPKSDAVKTLFASILGIQNVRKVWGKDAQKSEAAANALDALLEMRHRIVHGAPSDPEFTKTHVISYRQFLRNIVRKTDDETKKHLLFLTGSNPW